MYIIAQKELS